GQNVVLLDTVIAGFKATRIIFYRLSKYSGQCLLEPRVVRAALGRSNDIDKTFDFGVVSDITPQSHINFAGTFNVFHLGLAGCIEYRHTFCKVAFAVQTPSVGYWVQLGEIINALRYTSVILEYFFMGPIFACSTRYTAFITYRDPYAGH